MFDVSFSASPWFWLSVGMVLLVLETFGAAGYLLWLGVAAGAVGLLTFLVPTIPMVGQLPLFGVLAVLSALLCWRRQQRVKGSGQQPSLNQRAGHYVGLSFPLTSPIQGGRGKIKVGDSLWTVAGPDLPVGSRIRVIGQQGLILQVEPMTD